MDVRDMHFHKRNRHAGQRIAQGDAGMRESARIDHNGIDALLTGGVNAINQGTFVVALEAVERRAGLAGLQGGTLFNVRQGSRTVDFRLPRPQQIQVGAIQEEKVFCHRDKAPFDGDARILPSNDCIWQEKLDLHVLQGFQILAQLREVEAAEVDFFDIAIPSNQYREGQTAG